MGVQGFHLIPSTVTSEISLGYKDHFSLCQLLAYRQ